MPNSSPGTARTSILVAVAECVVEDGASVSFGVNPPFLWQYITGDYTNISVTTDGKRVQSANGMMAEVTACRRTVA